LDGAADHVRSLRSAMLYLHFNSKFMLGRQTKI